MFKVRNGFFFRLRSRCGINRKEHKEEKEKKEEKEEKRISCMLKNCHDVF
jgi:hypothetical protein